MRFDHALAQLILEAGDRDDALFFAGREIETASFEVAVRQARQFGKVEFRIFQGPPGCGKTSFAPHLRDSCGPETAVIQIYENDLASPRIAQAIPPTHRSGRLRGRVDRERRVRLRAPRQARHPHPVDGHLARR